MAQHHYSTPAMLCCLTSAREHGTAAVQLLAPRVDVDGEAGYAGKGPAHVVQWLHKVTLPNGVTLDDAAAMQLPSLQQSLLAILDSSQQVHVLATCRPRDMVTWQQYLEDGPKALESASGEVRRGS